MFSPSLPVTLSNTTTSIDFDVSTAKPKRNSLSSRCLAYGMVRLLTQGWYTVLFKDCRKAPPLFMFSYIKSSFFCIIAMARHAADNEIATSLLLIHEGFSLGMHDCEENAVNSELLQAGLEHEWHSVKSYSTIKRQTMSLRH